MSKTVLIIGSGIAGLATALSCADSGCQVTILTKSAVEHSNTRWAQGGIAAAIGDGDSVALHVEDTVAAGAGMNDREAVEFMVGRSPAIIEKLRAYGVYFAQDEEGELLLTKEGGHSVARIAYQGDTTGKAIQDALVDQVQSRAEINVETDCFVIDLLVQDSVCRGVVLLRSGVVETLTADAVVLATGGLGQLYQYTTNPPVATGDGVAMAYRAEAAVKDLEFIQFHPTVFAGSGEEEKSLLISEAVRGEGAYVVDEDGNRFLLDVAEEGELACRDVVARAIFQHLQEGHQVFIDARHLIGAADRFPFIYESLLERGLDMNSDLIPVQPAAHFCCGGIVTDLAGASSIPGLYVCGEVARTGVHGANRLASNSLLEAMVFAEAIGEYLSNWKPPRGGDINSGLANEWQAVAGILRRSDQEKLTKLFSEVTTECKKIMQQQVGVLRKSEKLESAFKELLALEDKVLGVARGGLVQPNSELHEDVSLLQKFCKVLNMVQVAILVAEQAKARGENVGGHWVT